MSSDTLARVKAILVRELNLDDIADDACREQVPEWDSLAYMSIVASLEIEFGIEATPQNIEKFGSVPGILGELQASGKG